MKKHVTKKRVVVLAALAVAAVAAVAGYAYWTNGGSGSGTATAGTADNNLVITASGWAGFKPGQTKNVDVNLDNSANSYSSYVKNVVLDTSQGTNGIATSNVGCLTTWFHYTAAASPNVDATLPASDSTNAFSSVGTLAFDDTATNQDACQGADVTVYLKVDNS